MGKLVETQRLFSTLLDRHQRCLFALAASSKSRSSHQGFEQQLFPHRSLQTTRDGRDLTPESRSCSATLVHHAQSVHADRQLDRRQVELRRSSRSRDHYVDLHGRIHVKHGGSNPAIEFNKDTFLTWTEEEYQTRGTDTPDSWSMKLFNFATNTTRCT